MTPKAQMSWNFLGHGTILFTAKILASSIATIFKSDDVEDCMYPLNHPSFPSPQINSFTCDL